MPQDFPIQDIFTAIDRQNMYHDALRQDIERLFDELTKDQLVVMRVIFNALADDDSGRLSAYYEGITSQTLKLRFNVCAGCGKDHAAEMLDESLHQQDPKKDLIDEFTSEQLACMKTYYLDDVRDEDTGVRLGFICKNCGMRYSTIEDRMLRPPDKCEGCILKAKWG
jgi:hypothetical protein